MGCRTVAVGVAAAAGCEGFVGVAAVAGCEAIAGIAVGAGGVSATVASAGARRAARGGAGVAASMGSGPATVGACVGSAGCTVATIAGWVGAAIFEAGASPWREVFGCVPFAMSSAATTCGAGTAGPDEGELPTGHTGTGSVGSATVGVVACVRAASSDMGGEWTAGSAGTRLAAEGWLGIARPDGSGPATGRTGIGSVATGTVAMATWI
jgi:hypothetical protein